LIAAALVRSWIDSRFQYYPQATAARQEAFAVASRESQTDKLERGFLKILKGWGQTDHAVLLSGNAEMLRGSNLELDVNCVAVQALRQLRWITPERLGREKTTPERAVLAELLSQQKLGVLILKEGPSLMVLVGAGVAASRRPYTYPQVTQLMELGSIFGGALERAHLTEKMQHAEQLATVGLLGASLAHEIRNPLVSIKTFVQLLPTRHQDPTFREKFFRLMTEEVNRIDRLTEQLLELASPRAYSAQMVELHSVLKASLELVAPKAADKRVGS
jgi:signal transduction histidine kinase